MGRPLDLNQSTGQLVRAGKNIVITSCWLPTAASASASCVIMRQIGTSKFLAQDTVTGNTGDVVLVQSVAAAGECSITVTTFAGATEHLMQIQQDHLETFEGNEYNWLENGTMPDATFASIVLGTPAT